MLVTAASERALRAALTTSFSQFLINRRRRTSATNLFKRTVKVLVSSELFQLVAGKPPSSATVWTLSRQPSGVSSAVSQKSLLALAWELSDQELEVVRYGPYSLKSSPILREPALVRFLVHLLGRADGALSLAQIAEVMRLRFNLTQLSQVEIDDQLASNEQPIIAQVEVSEVVSSVRSRLGRSAIEALREFSKAGGDFKRAAVILDTSPRQVQAEVSSAMSMIAEYAETLDEARVAYAKLVESLF
jgi:phage FluMu protein gp41